jgi:hypothetical protein
VELEALGTDAGVGAGAGHLICSKTDATGVGGEFLQGRAENELPVPRTL